MTIEPGRNLLHYKLVEKIGEGGMGVVWKALDTTLNREVAIKILPDLFAGDTERLARLEREAKLLASLNHANIAGIYGIHEAEGVRFIAMELIEGEDLSQRLSRGANRSSSSTGSTNLKPRSPNRGAGLKDGESLDSSTCQRQRDVREVSSRS